MLDWVATISRSRSFLEPICASPPNPPIKMTPCPSAAITVAAPHRAFGHCGFRSAERSLMPSSVALMPSSSSGAAAAGPSECQLSLSMSNLAMGMTFLICHSLLHDIVVANMIREDISTSHLQRSAPHSPAQLRPHALPQGKELKCTRQSENRTVSFCVRGSALQLKWQSCSRRDP